MKVLAVLGRGGDYDGYPLLLDTPEKMTGFNNKIMITTRPIPEHYGQQKIKVYDGWLYVVTKISIISISIL